MAAVDPYSPCPCGSGQKFKWCCHKVEAVADRSQRLYAGGQIDAAIHALDEGLRKERGNPWLLLRKAVFLLSQDRFEDAKAALREVLAKSPKHPGALALLSRAVLESEGPSAGIAQLQQALSVLPASERSSLARLVSIFGVSLAQRGIVPAALRHMRLALKLGGQESDAAATIRSIERNSAITPWLRNPDTLEPPPAGLPEQARERFVQALEWADDGLWSSAASAFEVLAAENTPGAVAAERNLGLCRLWLADNEAAVAALRRAAGRLGNTEDAVDLEGLAQSVEMPGPDDKVEVVQLIWPLRDRERLLSALGADPAIVSEPRAALDENDPDSPEADRFGLLDRPRIEKIEGLRIEDMPRFVGRVFVGQEIAGIETVDDGRLDGLVERFTELAQGAIPPAHPKTKVIDHMTRQGIALSWEWQTPDDLPPEEELRLDREQAKYVFEELWPNTPMAYLKGRTPLEAARAGTGTVALRAAIIHQEAARDGGFNRVIDFPAVRARLGLAPEPEIDPATVEIERVHISRLRLIPADRLDDDRLVKLYIQARRFALEEVIDAAGRVLDRRPEALEKSKLSPAFLYTDLAFAATGMGRRDEAFAWVEKGRRSGPAEEQLKRAPHWDMLTIQLRAHSQPPEEWVPELAVVLERYQDQEHANSTITLGLLEMGLIRMVPNPDNPSDMMLDPRLLHLMLTQYGPRVTTAAGNLGVTAAKGGIWTPGGTSGGGGTGIWTPGSDAGRPPGDESKPRLIIPGR